MRRILGAHSGAGSLSAERSRVLEALDEDVLTGPAIARRMDGPSTNAAARAGTDGEQAANSGDLALLYPALYSLEARWKLQAEWLPGTDGVRHRTYRRRRLLPRRATGEKPG
jgi:hypothetical protein